MPTDYTAKVRLGEVRTNGSAQFFRTIQKGNGVSYQIVAGGTTTILPLIQSGAVASLTNQSVSSVVPPTATEIVVMLSQTSASASAFVAPSTAYTITSTQPQSYSVTDDEKQVTFVLEGTNVAYASTGSGGAAGYLACYGWKNNVNAS